MAQFRPHGDTSVEVRGRVFVLRPKSHLNEEEMRRLLGQIVQRRAAFAGKPWGVLIVVTTTVLLTATAEHDGRQAFPGLVAAGLGAFAFAIPPSSERALIEAQAERVVGESPCPLRFFDTEGEAIAWISSSLD